MGCAVALATACDDAAGPGSGGQMARDDGVMDFGAGGSGGAGGAGGGGGKADGGAGDAAPPVDAALDCVPGTRSVDPCPQRGVCAGETTALCGPEGSWGPCELPSTAGEERCNALDDDCDGQTDETYPELYLPCDGEEDADKCELGQWRCAADGASVECVRDDEQFEQCNGVDDDCDGAVDETLPPPPAGENQVGICAGTLQICGGEAGWIEPDYTAIEGFEARELTCDGLDNDCDGRVDAGPFAPRAERAVGVCEGLRQVCGGAEGFMEPDYARVPGYEPDELTCDGQDNDCDGATDEALSPPPCLLTAGVCARPVVPALCLGDVGWVDCDYGPDYQRVERDLCDALDNDCDGQVDEGDAGCGGEGERTVRVPARAYTQGSPDGELGRDADEGQRPVVLTRTLLVRATELTQQEWVEITGDPSPAFFLGADRPVEQVTWLDAVRALNLMSQRDRLPPCYVINGDEVTWPDGLACTGWRLPTEAEWEYLARGGSAQAHWGRDLGLPLSTLAWYRENSGEQTHGVGQLAPNPYGLHDMLGNVAEWTWDIYGPYGDGEAQDPLGAEAGPTRVARGGSYLNPEGRVRAANRAEFEPATRLRDLGLRPVRTLREE